MISPVKTLVTATAVSHGGRNGHSETTDHSVAVDLSVPKEMGGPGKPGTTTPEHLFATGYAACFGGALDFVASSKKKNAKAATVTCAVGVGPREAGGFGVEHDNIVAQAVHFGERQSHRRIISRACQLAATIQRRMSHSS